MSTQNKTDRMKMFAQKLKDNGANFNEAYLEVYPYLKNEDLTINIVESVFTPRPITKEKSYATKNKV